LISKPGRCFGRVFSVLILSIPSRQRAAAIERSTASLGQQSTLRPADF
jgi:hypothetical protein